MTPMMEQYLEIKAANPGLLLFYRMGDFYELFFEDAEIASRALGIMLTRRGKHQGVDIPMCGVPVERSDDYLHRLIALGHRVAVCEQMEDPAAARRHAARCQGQQLSAGAGACPRLRRRSHRAGLDRHLDSRIYCHRMRHGRTRGDTRAHQPQ